MTLVFFPGASAPEVVGMNDSRTLTPVSFDTSRLRPDTALFLPAQS
jgi:hypothetical protein